jgi:hypothetical protein
MRTLAETAESDYQLLEDLVTCQERLIKPTVAHRGLSSACGQSARAAGAGIVVDLRRASSWPTSTAATVSL